MSFVHEDPEFDDLLQIVAGDRKLPRGLIEKDYWVTHALWAAGFEVWFKGGTSLSKGFGLIERFSEDLDLKIEPGAVRALPRVSSWKSEGTKATTEHHQHGGERVHHANHRLPGLVVAERLPAVTHLALAGDG